VPRSSADYWRSFWAEQRSPLNRKESDKHYVEYGAELRVLVGHVAARRVLELACGDGALFEHLGFATTARYLGVDFSASMLDVFQARHPGVETVCAPGETFRVDEVFDVIFSSAFAQYLDRKQLATHLGNASAMLAPGGRIVVAANPWRRMRFAFARADVAGKARRSLPLALAAHVRRLIVHDSMGQWHDYPEIDAMAARLGLSARYFGSILYPYRFHAVLARAADGPVLLEGALLYGK
jgi:SAM-dependent methyltransferase